MRNTSDDGSHAPLLLRGFVLLRGLETWFAVATGSAAVSVFLFVAAVIAGRYYWGRRLAAGKTVSPALNVDGKGFGVDVKKNRNNTTSRGLE
eukprot:1180610-Prorocentrum_minimum.AAC.2